MNKIIIQDKLLKENKKKFQTIYEASPDTIMLLDELGFLDCNPATLKMFACATAEEFLGRHPGECSPPTQPDGKASREAVDKKIAAAYKNNTTLFEWVHQRANGEMLRLHVMMMVKALTWIDWIIRDLAQSVCVSASRLWLERARLIVVLERA